jgi:hypothetical protein
VTLPFLVLSGSMVNHVHVLLDAAAFGQFLQELRDFTLKFGVLVEVDMALVAAIDATTLKVLVVDIIIQKLFQQLLVGHILFVQQETEIAAGKNVLDVMDVLHM